MTTTKIKKSDRQKGEGSKETEFVPVFQHPRSPSTPPATLLPALITSLRNDLLIYRLISRRWPLDASAGHRAPRCACYYYYMQKTFEIQDPLGKKWHRAGQVREEFSFPPGLTIHLPAPTRLVSLLFLGSKWILPPLVTELTPHFKHFTFPIPKIFTGWGIVKN